MPAFPANICPGGKVAAVLNAAAQLADILFWLVVSLVLVLYSLKISILVNHGAAPYHKGTIWADNRVVVYRAANQLVAQQLLDIRHRQAGHQSLALAPVLQGDRKQDQLFTVFPCAGGDTLPARVYSFPKCLPGGGSDLGAIEHMETAVLLIIG